MSEQHEPSAPAPAGVHPPAEPSIRETLQSLVLAFVLAFVFRAFVVEAFTIPTGSMAPTLLGRHVTVRDASCGQEFAVNRPDSRGGYALSEPMAVAGPMTRREITLAVGTRIEPGDRVLVEKFLYFFQEPRRWDVVVFKYPEEPRQNFIKRLVGLPGERVWIIDGNVYVCPSSAREGVDPADEAGWRIARKMDRGDGAAVQNAVWQAIYHSGYRPAEAEGWRSPWEAVEGAWRKRGAGQEEVLEDEKGYELRGSGRGVLRFDYEGWVASSSACGPGMYPYNQPSRGSWADQAIEDVRLAGTFTARADGLEVELVTGGRLDDAGSRSHDVGARIDAQGRATLWREAEGGGERVRVAGPVEVGAFEAGRPRRVELWVVDQEVWLWVDGEARLRWGYDVPMRVLHDRPGPSLRPARTEVRVAGAGVTVREVDLDRDLYYDSAMVDSPDVVARGGLAKFADQRRGEPVRIGKDLFFCLGDNSPDSHDGRFWRQIDGWVEARSGVERGALLGLVPRKLLVGRAFFVYWPAPRSLTPGGLAFIPDFGRMRAIH
ncbi:MAG: signal peptidase I [Phycisphaeraceae bacterium]|nr:signal peptidase I [Phycisphaeraceae bacterium]